MNWWFLVIVIIVLIIIWNIISNRAETFAMVPEEFIDMGSLENQLAGLFGGQSPVNAPVNAPLNPPLNSVAGVASPTVSTAAPVVAAPVNNFSDLGHKLSDQLGQSLNQGISSLGSSLSSKLNQGIAGLFPKTVEKFNVDDSLMDSMDPRAYY